MSGVDRRTALSLLGTSTALPAIGQQRSASGFNFLTEPDAAFVAAAADRFIPADDFPGATAAGALTYIDRQLSGPWGRGERMYLAGPVRPGEPQQGYQLALAPAQVYRESLDAVHTHARGRGFASASADEQDNFLRSLEAGEWMLGNVPSSVFFETLLSNVIESYFADPLYGGNKDMVGWRMVGFPGAYAHYVQWVGRHNVRFNRPPVAIASSAAGAPAHQHGSHGEPADPRVPQSARPSKGR